MNENLIFLNGIDGVTGQYLAAPLSPAEAAAHAAGRTAEPETTGWLKRVRDVLLRPFMGLPLDVDPTLVPRAGWAVVFGSKEMPEVRSALDPLIAHRRTTVPPDRCKVLEYRAGEGMKAWLKRHGVYPGNVVPPKVPYYVLLVGNPDSIPFDFQYLLDVEYAVGRLAFDRPEQYRQYAESVIAYEKATAVPNRRDILYWAPRHAADRATQLSADSLVAPLAEGIPATASDPAEPALGESYGFRSRTFKRAEATRANLLEELHAARSGPPALLFTASHGVGFPKGHEQQRDTQGALLAQDWTGFGAIDRQHYVTAAEIGEEAQVHGLVAFCFACYGAGTPAFDHFLADRQREPLAIADAPFVAALPQRLLSHPGGAALAVLGHIDRAWGYSFRPQGLAPQLTPFRNCLGRILRGEPVGHATKDFSEKYATLSAELLSLLDASQPGDQPSEQALAWTWVERNDAQNYVLLGDPAVRIRVGDLK